MTCFRCLWANIKYSTVQEIAYLQLDLNYDAFVYFVIHTHLLVMAFIQTHEQVDLRVFCDLN